MFVRKSGSEICKSYNRFVEPPKKNRTRVQKRNKNLRRLPQQTIYKATLNPVAVAWIYLGCGQFFAHSPLFESALFESALFEWAVRETRMSVD